MIFPKIYSKQQKIAYLWENDVPNALVKEMFFPVETYQKFEKYLHHIVLEKEKWELQPIAKITSGFKPSKL